MEHQLFALIEEDAAAALHQALGLARGARGEHDHGRVVEGELLEGDIAAGLVRDEVLEGEGAPDRREVGARVPGVVGHHHPLDAGDGLHQLRGVREAVEDPLLVAVGIDGEEHRGLDLTQALGGGGRADVGGAARPEGAESGGSQHAHGRLDQVGHVGGHPVTHAHACGAQGLGHAGHRLVELGVAHAPRRRRLAHEHEGGALVPETQQVLGEVEAGAGEPVRAGEHREVLDRRCEGHGGLDLEELPGRRPEGGDVGDRPTVEGVVGVEGQGVARVHVGHEAGHVGGGDLLRRWLPQRRRQFTPPRIPTTLSPETRRNLADRYPFSLVSSGWLISLPA